MSTGTAPPALPGTRRRPDMSRTSSPAPGSRAAATTSLSNTAVSRSSPSASSSKPRAGTTGMSSCSGPTWTGCRAARLCPGRPSPSMKHHRSEPFEDPQADTPEPMAGAVTQRSKKTAINRRTSQIKTRLARAARKRGFTHPRGGARLGMPYLSSVPRECPWSPGPTSGMVGPCSSPHCSSVCGRAWRPR